MADLVQYDIFGNPVTVDLKNNKKAIQQRNQERARKAAETRQMKRKEFETLWWRMYHIARECENGNLFGETHTEQERQEAEAFIQKYEVNGRLRKPKTNEVYNRIRQIVEEVVRDTFSI